MNSKEIRRSFLNFFKEKEHKIVPGAPVIPFGDPTLLFTNAGMNQFKDVFLGSGSRDYSRAVDTQKCIRVSGKHNDLEEVGRDTYHHTFFEMLGNWSFGDYYKEEAIAWAWELLTEVWKLDKDRLYATVYETDKEAFEIWKKYLPEERILYFGEKDNFWEMGNTGPCGPCSEIHYDATPEKSGKDYVNADRPEVIEIWNLVFIQYNRKDDGSLEDLKHKHIDTGMGFERICAVIQGKNSNYDTDVFMPLINKIAQLSGREYSKELNDPDGTAMRVIADHVRTLSFAIADGALPGNEGRSYVLRRVLRRASRFARNLGFDVPVIYKLVPVLVEEMGDFFDGIKQQQATIEKVIKGEEESFLKTLDRGLELFDDITAHLKEKGKGSIEGHDAFKLYDTYGFPIDLTQLIASENGLKVDMKGFEDYMAEQKKRSREARKDTKQEIEVPVIEGVESEFTGYHNLSQEAKILYAEDNKIVLDKTPFYVESGGQVSDTGKMIIDGEAYEVIDTKNSGEAIVHILDRKAVAEAGKKAFAEVDRIRRKRIMRNHSATHLLHEALRTLLGDHVKQAGSLVAPDYLRFDFNHFQKVEDDEIEQIEKLVNEKIFAGYDVNIQEVNIDEAQKDPKIKMFFGDKYGESVRVITMDPSYSKELCGGTHVDNTAEIGIFKIKAESSVASGVRRIEAITAEQVQEYIYDLEENLAKDQKEFEEYNKKIRKLEREVNELKTLAASAKSGSLTDEAVKVDDIRVVAQKTDLENMDQMRELADNIRKEFKTKGIALFAMENNGKVQLVCTVTDDIKEEFSAGKLIGKAAQVIGGGGGGRPHLATAGGKNPEKLPELLEIFPKIVEEFSS